MSCLHVDALSGSCNMRCTSSPEDVSSTKWEDSSYHHESYDKVSTWDELLSVHVLS